MRKFIYAGAVIALFLIFFLSIVDVKEKNGGISAASFMENVTVINKGHGMRQWTLINKRSDFSEDGNEINMKSVNIDMPSENIIVDSNNGVYNLERGDLALSGDINAKTKDFLLKTDKMSINPGSGDLYCDGKVLISGKGFKLEGIGLRTFDKKIRLLSDVKAIFY